MTNYSSSFFLVRCYCVSEPFSQRIFAMASVVGYNKLVAVIFQKYREGGKSINLAEARKKADKISKNVDLNNDAAIIAAADMV